MTEERTDRPDPVLSGGCLCGRVTYTAAAAVISVACHCRACQRQTGSAFSTITAVPAASFVPRGETASYETRGDDEGVVHRHFCRQCGSPVFSNVVRTPEWVWLKAGTLDLGPPPPLAHLWMESAVPWLVDAFPHASTFPRNPPPAR